MTTDTLIKPSGNPLATRGGLPGGPWNPSPFQPPELRVILRGRSSVEAAVDLEVPPHLVDKNLPPAAGCR